MIRRTLTALASAAALIALSAPAHAAPVIYFGENQNPANQVSGAPLTARTSFLSQLVGVGTETFSGFNVGDTSPLTLTFTGSTGNIQADLNGVGQVFGPGPIGVGRFNTSGAEGGPVGGNWWDSEGRFTIDFDVAISAFGFYGTDIGDFNGQVTVALTDINDVVTNLVINNTVNGNNGSLLFWGFIDTMNSYKRITFGNTAAGSDFFGFDDMTIGDRQQIRVPEPATLALVGLSLLGLGAVRRRS